jgi:hypothetical protein
VKIILHNIIRKKTIKSIEDIGQGICEIIVDIDLSFGVCNSVEYVGSEGAIYIHIFEDDDYDIVIDFDDLSEEDKLKILKKLNTI